MPEPVSDTIVLQGLLDRLAAGDALARNALINHAAIRLLNIARKLLGKFGGEARVGMWSTDVLNTAIPRLMRAVDVVKPSTPKEFFGLAWLQMQRELLDIVRGMSKVEGDKSAGSERVSPGTGDQIDLVIDLMEAINNLPDRQRETTWLKLGGNTHREIADFLGVHHDTVDDYWKEARKKLAKLLAPFVGTL